MACSCSLVQGHSLWKRLGIQDREAVADFFIVFARFEFALKQAGYYRRLRGEQIAPDWGRFAEDHAGKFNCGDGELQHAKTYLLQDPPRRQQLEGGKPCFSDADRYGDGRASELEKLIDIVKGVRNNLFHGGKFPSGPVTETGRDSQLLKAAMCVLEHAVELDEKVKQFFLG